MPMANGDGDGYMVHVEMWTDLLIKQMTGLTFLDRDKLHPDYLHYLDTHTQHGHTLHTSLCSLFWMLTVCYIYGMYV